MNDCQHTATRLVRVNATGSAIDDRWVYECESCGTERESA